jgi:flagellar hook-associated protein 1 FlgK
MANSSLSVLGTRALFANYAALQVTGNNIANANTPGYSRQTVEFANSGGQFTGAGFFGKGVDVATVSRAHSEFLTSELATATALSAADETRAAALRRLEGIFVPGESGLGHVAGQFLNAFVDVASSPQDSSARQVVLARAGDLADRFRAAGDRLTELQAGVVQDLGVAINSVNTLAKGVAALNDKITDSLGLGHQPNDLLDQRDEMIRKISELVAVTTVPASDGAMSVFIGGGQRLVVGAQASRLALSADSFDPTRVGIALQEAGKIIPLSENILTAGKIGGLMRVQNVDLVDARNLLGQMAQAVASAVNDQQALGLGLGTPPQPGAPIFSTGALRVAPAGANAKVAGVDVASYVNGSGVRVPSVSIAITDATQLQASDYELATDPGGAAGVYQLTRLRDGLIQSVAAGAVVDGFRIDIVAPLPVAGDRFLLQPVGGAAINMQRVLADPRGVAAASPVAATAAGANTGTGSVASLHAVSTSLNPALTATIDFTSATGNYNWELRDASNALVSSGAAVWQAGTPITLNGFELQLAGVPASGDRFTVQATAFPAANNGNALALVQLRSAALVGATTLSGGAVMPGATITDAYANAMTEIGIRVQGAGMTAQMSASVLAEAKAAQNDKSGVNLDEEAARLIQFQQAYQAAAKMLQVAQSVFETLLRAGGAG